MDFKTQIVNFLTGLKDTCSAAAPIAIVIGLFGIAGMFALAPFPVVGEWKKQHPQAFTNIMIAIGVVALIPTLVSMMPAG